MGWNIDNRKNPGDFCFLCLVASMMEGPKIRKEESEALLSLK
jgi:hypothetical protein